VGDVYFSDGKVFVANSENGLMVLDELTGNVIEDEMNLICGVGE
jgi:hypothetical protein